MEEGYDFIDDIIWVKPEGAGWATGRGRRFAADRNPLQYKAVPVTEYVLVFRKRTELLIDWHIRNHPNRDLVKASKIKDGYEKTKRVAYQSENELSPSGRVPSGIGREGDRLLFVQGGCSDGPIMPGRAQ